MLFPDFRETRIEAEPGVEIFCRIGGNEGGPGLLLIHGNPQTSAMWHRVVPHLVDAYHIICPDLRGYGRSAKPQTAPDHAPYSKRAMAVDLVAVMDHLDHQTFHIAAHDRGARVAHRLALDHENRVRAMVLLDIAPTREMYRDATSAFAQDYWHWYWMTQPAPFPETMMSADPDWFWKSRCARGDKGLTIFAPAALEEYLTCFREEGVIEGSCEDYRAARTIDIAHDDADGDRKLETPLRVLWGGNGAIEKHFDCLALWHERAVNVTGKPLPGGHYLAEECPDRVATEIITFCAEHATAPA